MSAWRWVRRGWQHHLARKTCRSEWVFVCEALTTWPFSATPERLNIRDGTTAWALKQTVPTHTTLQHDVRIRLDQKAESVCPRCKEHAKEIAALWRGIQPRPRHPPQEPSTGLSH